jgi:hypothetical protein
MEALLIVRLSRYLHQLRLISKDPSALRLLRGEYEQEMSLRASSPRSWRTSFLGDSPLSPVELSSEPPESSSKSSSYDASTEFQAKRILNFLKSPRPPTGKATCDDD